LVYFGYPRAHEDDAERAVRAGLGVIDAVGRLDLKSVKLQPLHRDRHRLAFDRQLARPAQRGPAVFTRRRERGDRKL
jgi:hypothetical protein